VLYKHQPTTPEAAISAAKKALVALAACVGIHLFASLFAPAATAQTQVTYSAEWCRHLPRPEYKALERVPVRSRWFEVYRVRPGVFALYEPHQAEEVISYLIVGSRKALLFDTGMGIASIRAVVRQLTRLPITVLNSHTHYDHVGGNREFPRILGMDTAFTRERAAKGYFNEVMRVEVSPGNLCGPLPKGFDPGAYHVPPFRIAATVRDGSVIDLGERKLEVIAVPGHTPDSIALLDRGHRLLFTGDTFYVGPIWLFEPETDLAAYARSTARLASLADGDKVDLLLPGHNTPAASPAYLVKLRDAAQAIVAGTIKETSRENGRRRFQFDGFSLLAR
jgi:glyoxylase-like metal-dependent hydrolase (beta-lactamase superfamily II)